jgi:hypothetical protein
MTRLDAYREGDIYWRIAISVGHYVGRTDEGLSLTVARNVALGVIKKFYSEHCIRCSVEAALNRCATATTRCWGKGWVILQMIWASDIIAVMIGRDIATGIAGGLQIDAEAGIREDGVPENGVVNVPGVWPDGYSGTKEIACSAVEGDDVACAGDRAANGIVVAGVAAVINY